MLARVGPTTALQAMTGFTIVGLGVYDAARRRIRKAFAEHLASQDFLKEQFDRHFETAQAKVAPFSLEVWEATTDEFLMGDIPVAAWDRDTDRVGVLNGANWGNTGVVFMPLGPRQMVALSQDNRYREADVAAVERLNVVQVRAAYREVYFRSSSGLGDIIAEALRDSR